jgi:putative endonuclease
LGVTSNLIQRIWQHRSGLAEGLTRCYGVHILVWYGAHDTMENANAREKAIRGRKRIWKLGLIEERNRQWSNVYEEPA